MPELRALAVGEINLAVHDSPGAADGQTLLCLHETGASAASWHALAEALAGELSIAVLRYDRRGWGDSEVPVPYTRTSVTEQAQDALALLDALDVGRAILCGAGLGAVAALDLALREPTRVTGVIAVEPPLLALVDGATEGLSQDIETLRKAAEETAESHSGVSGPDSAARLFLAGDLPFLAPGSDRIAGREAVGGGDGLESRRKPGSLLAELGAVPAWPLPFEALEQTAIPISVVVGRGTPAPIVAAAGSLAAYTPTGELAEPAGEDPLEGLELARLVEALAT